jgi:hypothetical protein
VLEVYTTRLKVSLHLSGSCLSAGDRCTYIPDYERPDPETRRAWDRIRRNQLREYTEYPLQAGVLLFSVSDLYQ